MIFYCENCLLLNQQDYCKSCGKRNLRNPDDRDFCLLTEVAPMFGLMFKRVLESENIPFHEIYIRDIRGKSTFKLENLKIFVPYQYFDKATQLLAEIIEEKRSRERQNLVENVDKLFVSKKSDKKIKKAFKMFENEDLIAFCKDKILSADRVENRGAITGNQEGGQYIYVYKDNYLIIINSATFEIISAKRKQISFK